MAGQDGYTRAQIGLHWAVAVLILFQLLFHDGMEKAWDAVSRGLPVEGVSAPLHVAAGMTVLVLTLVRLLLKLRHGAPAPTAESGPMLQLAAKAGHVALYALLVIVPASGAAAWLGGVEPAADAHGVLFALLMLVVAVHTAAALFHQYILRDNLIARMVRAR